MFINNLSTKLFISLFYEIITCQCSYLLGTDSLKCFDLNFEKFEIFLTIQGFSKFKVLLIFKFDEF